MRRLSKVEIKYLKKFYQKLSDMRNLVLSTKWFENHLSERDLIFDKNDVHLSNDFFTRLLIDNLRIKEV